MTITASQAAEWIAPRMKGWEDIPHTTNVLQWYMNNRLCGIATENGEIKGVACASLEELLTDYVDFLRVRDLRQWEKDSPEALLIRQMGREPGQSFESYRPLLEDKFAEVWANTAVCLIHQANYLLDQQLRCLEQEFLRQGGMRERMAKARSEVRWKTSQS